MSDNEKLPLVSAEAPPPQRRSWMTWRLIPTALLLLWLHNSSQSHGPHWHRDRSPALAQCLQIEPLKPSQNSGSLTKMDDYLESAKFRNETISRMAGAIQIPSESFDDMGPVGEDKRWDIMYDMAAYLEKTFPHAHSTLQLEKVNTHGLLYTWQGSDSSLKPTLLMAHQDVVPVAESTVGQWTHPPFSGAYDGTFVWGRGALDCKNTLIGILEAVELLIEAGFEPKRTLLLSFGFDEEISGGRGAGKLAPFILERYGEDSVAAIVDEGAGVSSIWGTNFAMPGVAEKGYIDVEIIVRMPGGHSSVPPPHTGIGVMSDLLTTIEANPYEPHLHEENPYLALLQCGAAHSEEFPSKLKKLLPSHKAHSCEKKKDKLALEAAKASLAVKYLFTTSVAVDIIGGGVKVNALPERTRAVVNHRVNVGDHAADVEAKITKLAGHIADKYNLTLHAFTDDAETPSSITLKSNNHKLEPAPVSPTSVDTLTPYAVLSGTTRALYGKEMIVSPGLMTGNTDTRYYWSLSKHIFRYAPGWDPIQDIFDGIHTVNERVSVVGHIKTVQWFSLFIRNIDEAVLE